MEETGSRRRMNLKNLEDCLLDVPGIDHELQHLSAITFQCFVTVQELTHLMIKHGVIRVEDYAEFLVTTLIRYIHESTTISGRKFPGMKSFTVQNNLRKLTMSPPADDCLCTACNQKFDDDNKFYVHVNKTHLIRGGGFRCLVPNCYDLPKDSNSEIAPTPVICGSKLAMVAHYEDCHPDQEIPTKFSSTSSEDVESCIYEFANSKKLIQQIENTFDITLTFRGRKLSQKQRDQKYRIKRSKKNESKAKKSAGVKNMVTINKNIKKRKACSKTDDPSPPRKIVAKRTSIWVNTNQFTSKIKDWYQKSQESESETSSGEGGEKSFVESLPSVF